MRVWAKVIQHHRIQKEVVQEFASARPSDLRGWTEVIVELAKPLDLAVPIILEKHIGELQRFSRTVFRQPDFMENVSFDSFEIELFAEKKKETETRYIFD